MIAIKVFKDLDKVGLFFSIKELWDNEGVNNCLEFVLKLEGLDTLHYFFFILGSIYILGSLDPRMLKCLLRRYAFLGIFHQHSLQ